MLTSDSNYMSHLKTPLSYLCREYNGDWQITTYFKGDTKKTRLRPSKLLSWIDRAIKEGYNLQFREDPYKYIKRENQ